MIHLTSPTEALSLTARLLGVFALIQSAEFLILARTATQGGVWTGGNFRLLNMFRAVVAAGLIVVPNPFGLLILLGLHIKTILRFLGSFNGGSDAMNLLLLWTSVLGLLGGERAAQIAVGYITFQLCFSYFKAGFFKIRNAAWRNGSALRAFIQSSFYVSTTFINRFSNSDWLMRIGSWILIGFELSFPLSALQPKFAIIYMCAGAFFHLCNAYVFGLNRFFFAWVSAYPALYYVSQLRLS